MYLRHAARQHFGLPRRRGEFAALQLSDDLQRAIHAVQLRARREMLPAIQEGVEFGRGDRLDFAAQAADGEPVDARQQAAVAPFEFARPGVKLAAQNLAFGFQLRQRLVHQVARHGERCGQVARRVSGPEHSNQPRRISAAQASGLRELARVPAGAVIGGWNDGLRVDAAHQIETLGRHPEIAAVDGERGGAAGGHQLLEQRRKLRLGGHQAQAAKRLVQFVGIAHGRPGFGGHLRDGGGVERAGALGVIGGQRAAHLHGAGAALFERRIVEDTRTGLALRISWENGEGSGVSMATRLGCRHR